MAIAAVAGIVGVSAYVAAWSVAGATRPGYDPLRQAISELFEVGVFSFGREMLVASLVLSGIALIAFGFAMDRGLPGTGRAGPAAATLSGVMTVLVGLAPCTPGCPGVGSSAMDTAHIVFAAIGYIALCVAPLLTAERLRHHAPTLAVWSTVFGIIALGGFMVRALGFADVVGGLQQRIFNTVADAWYVIIALRLLLDRRRALVVARQSGSVRS